MDFVPSGGNPSWWCLLKMAEVTLVDYGLGNIRAFANIYHSLNIAVDIASDAKSIAEAKRLILPGVGAFDWAMDRLNQSGLRDTLDQRVLQQGVPVLGVCVGMQMMAESSEEGRMPGLSWIKGEVVRFDHSSGDLPLPHMGWNDVSPETQECLFSGISDPRFYFLHSYCFVPTRSEAILARAHYGDGFVAAVRSANIFATQFHPEKSHHWGVRLLRNFAEMPSC